MAFRDYIPEGELDGEPLGDGGFQDFVPPKKPQPREELVVEPEVKESPKPTKKAKGK